MDSRFVVAHLCMDSGYVVAHLWTRNGSQVADRGYLGQRGPDLNPAYRTGTK